MTTTDARHTDQHDAWDQGGYCNALVADENGDGDTCGYRQPQRAATFEDAAKVLDFHLSDADNETGCAMRCGYRDDERAEHIAQALAAANLLARPVPGRDEIARTLDRAGAFCGECGNEPGAFFDSCPECRRWLGNYADAVLALLSGGDPR